MFSNKKFKSDYISLFNNIDTSKQTLPSGYPCTFDSDCTSPSVCQFNVCTINIGGNEINNLSNICRGKSIKDCAKEMQKERESTEVPIYVPNFPTPPIISNTGNNGNINVPAVNINSPSLCKYDKECNKTEVCISGVCVNKSNFPLIARQRKLKSVPLQTEKQNIYATNQIRIIQEQKINDFNIKKYFQHKNTPLDGKLSPYEYMFLLETNENQQNNKNILNGTHDDYFYFNNKL